MDGKNIAVRTADKLTGINRMNKGRINPDKCEHCGKGVTKEGHDGCIGTLPDEVMNACCGHGEDRWAYVQFGHGNYHNDPNRYLITGNEAINYIEKNKE